MPPKKRSQANTRRHSKRPRPSELTETTPDAANTVPPAGNVSVPSNMVTIDLQALTASISVAVSQAVKQALEQAASATVQTPQEKTREVESV